MSRKDGGPAFPVTTYKGTVQHEALGFGMSLRDYFAAAALQGWIASLTGDEMYHTVRDEKLFDEHHKTVAELVYKYADAMLAERDKR